MAGGIKFLSKPSECRMDDHYYDIARPNHFWVKWRFEFLCRMLSDEFRGALLDIGCGNGVVLEQIFRRFGCTGDGAELNLNALNQFMAKESARLFYDIAQRDASLRARYGTVLLLDVLEHIPQPVSFLEATRFHMAPGALVAINVPAIQSLYSRFDSLQGHVRRFDIKTLSDVVAQSGLVLEDVRYWGFGLVPIAWLRKQVIRNLPDDQVMLKGFDPAPLAGRVMSAIGRVERALPVRWPVGTSLMAIARNPS